MIRSGVRRTGSGSETGGGDEEPLPELEGLVLSGDDSISSVNDMTNDSSDDRIS